MSRLEVLDAEFILRASGMVTMTLDVLRLTHDLVAIPSVSRDSNEAVSDVIEATLGAIGCEVERLEYTDPNGERKVSLVGKKGVGTGGLVLFSHSDTVPGTGWTRDAWGPTVEGDRLIGLGACDMKGPLAATILAAADLDAASLKQPVYIVVTADEENGGVGAQQVARESRFILDGRPRMGVVAEPTQLRPVYAHKGGARLTVTAHGVAAHTSTDRGTSATFLIAPFLADMADYALVLKADKSYQNAEFDPPTNGFNMVINDGNCAINVSAAKTVCTLSFRPMPHDRSQDILDHMEARARAHGLDFTYIKYDPFYTPPDAEVVQLALRASGAARAGTVPFGTDAWFLDHLCPLVVLGPGNIAQAHTDGEWIDIPQLRESVSVYRRMIDMVCS